MKALYFFGITLIFLTGCKSGKSVNLFSIEDDKKLGAQVASQIESDTSGYIILDSAKNAKVYQYIYGIRNELLNSGQLKYKNEFPWRIRVIHDDSTLNAFCTPGGYIYVFTGILKFLDSGDQLAGVLGHEMGHADMRHSTRQMTQMFGVQVLLEVIAGKQDAIKQIGGALIGLKFSRNHEVEADNCSVQYLCPTPYNAAGGAGFFEKIQAMGGAKVPEFLSTHPDPGNRIEVFKAKKQEFNCKGIETYKNEYQAMVKLLP
ncbi:MAG: M48 family metalloprotease [Crocinitomicaceae bacterium]